MSMKANQDLVKKPKSIVIKLTLLIIGLIIFQTLIFAGFLIQGGVLEQANQNAYQLFHDKVNSRKDYLEREMKNNWTNFEPYYNAIATTLTISESEDAFFKATFDNLIAMLRTTQATGAYVILYDGDTAPSTVYLRDYDPVSNARSDDDIYMLYGPSELAKSRKIPLDQTWEYRFQMDESNSTFITKPYEKSAMTYRSSLLGYWSRPFKLNENDVSIVTYSMPLFDSLGQIRGIIGIDVTLNYIAEFLPAQDLQPQDSLGYLIVYNSDGSDQLNPIIMGGPLQQRMIDGETPLSLSLVDNEKQIYSIKDHKGKEKLFASVEKIGLYQSNTPFENECWFLVGIMREDYLLSQSSHIESILIISLILSVLIGIAGGIIASLQMTKPIVNLANEVRTRHEEDDLSLSPTGLLELDELSQTIQNAHKDVLDSASRLSNIIDLIDVPIAAFEINYQQNKVFVTENFYELVCDQNQWPLDDVATFEMKMAHLLSQPEEEDEDVYRLGSKDSCWIKLQQIKNDQATVGVIIDVSEEMREKLQIMRDRDHDALTDLLNRKGFENAYMTQIEKGLKGISALIMFDLDNLKKVNDTYGHHWGDEYILKAVQWLKTITNGDKMILGRRSGDEFVVLMTGFETKADILNHLNKFYKSLNHSPIDFPDGKSYQVLISGGLKWLDTNDLSFEKNMDLADKALYEAKNSGKGKYTIYK